MKKALVLLLALSLVGGLMFAEGGKITATGNVQAQWGMDLDHTTSGFKSVIDSVKLIFTLPTENNAVKATGDEGSTSYGEISIGNVRFYTEVLPTGGYASNAAPVALKWDGFGVKLVMGQLTLQFLDGASVDMNYAGAKLNNFFLSNAFQYDVYDGLYGASNQRAALDTWSDGAFTKFDVPGNTWNFDFAKNYGIVAKYALPSMADISLDIASYKAWDARDLADVVTPAVPSVIVMFYDASAGVVDVVTAADLVTALAGVDFATGDSVIAIEDTTTPAVTTTGVPTAADRFAAGDQGDNAYTGRLSVSVTAVPNLTAKAGVSAGYLDPSLANGRIGIDFGGQVGYAVKVGETITITPQAAIDVQAANGERAFFAAGGVTAALMGAKVVVNTGFGNSDKVLGDWKDGGLDTDNTAFSSTVTADAGTLVPNLTAKAAFEWIDPAYLVSKDETYAIFAQLGYGVKASETITITPWLKGSFDNKNASKGAAKDTSGDYDNRDMFMKIGVDVTGLLKNTTFTAKWDSNDLIQDINPAQTNELGEFVLIAKVSF